MKFTKISSPSQILWILTLINFFNYFDRQVVYPLFAFLKSDFLLTDFELGLLGTVFMVVHSITSIPMGILADKVIRKNLITTGVLVWSLATFFSGLTHNFSQLLAARSAVGIGEASYSPAATSILADKFSETRRAEINSIFHLGMFIGGTFGMMLAGLLGTFIGWRLCFFLVGLPGFILAIFSWNISEEKRHHTQLLKLERSTFEYIFKSKPYMLTIAGGVMLTFTSASIISWITEFLIRYHNYTVSEASVTFGIIVLIAGIAGIYSGGYLADRFFKVYNLPRSFIIAVCFIISSPVLYIIITTENKYLLIITLIIATFLMSMYYGPSVSLIQDILPKYKATAYAFYLFFAHLLGSTIAPSVIGKVSDLSNLRSALYIPVITNFAGGLLFLITTRLMYSINSKNTIS